MAVDTPEPCSVQVFPTPSSTAAKPLDNTRPFTYSCGMSALRTDRIGRSGRCAYSYRAEGHCGGTTRQACLGGQGGWYA